MRLESKAKSPHNYAILLAGGEGSRFWPLSRTLEPKQFLALHRDKSLFEQTIIRIQPLIRSQNIYIVTSELYRHQILELANLFKIPGENIIFEPYGKNTAPPIGLAVGLIDRKDENSRICVLPCDHLIKNSKEFSRILARAFQLCDEHLVIFGVPPYRPATGYGYIQVANGKWQMANSKWQGASRNGFKVKRFTEKPDLKTAESFLKSGDYYWNSGIFAARSDVFLKEFKTYLPQLYKQCQQLRGPSDINLIWKKIRPISFDYGVLEKSRRLLMLPVPGLGWSDLGNWQAWDEILKKDKQGNILRGDVLNLGSKNISVLGSKRLIATIGLENLVIVDTSDALLITSKDKTESVKKIVDILKDKRRLEHYAHKTVKRPWGCYTVLETGVGFKVRLVEVKPGNSLSRQIHRERSEHWVVVEGTAEVVKGSKTSILNANESTYISKGCAHRLTNPMPSLLKIVEVQVGSYLEEDDIVRLNEDCNRA